MRAQLKDDLVNSFDISFVKIIDFKIPQIIIPPVLAFHPQITES